MSKQKAQGTAFETLVANILQDHGLIAERIAEGGINDRGDVRVFTDYEWILECKHRTNLNAHQTLEKTIQKAGTADAALVWKKSVRKPGNTNRTQEGPIMVSLSLDRFARLLKEASS